MGQVLPAPGLGFYGPARKIKIGILVWVFGVPGFGLGFGVRDSQAELVALGAVEFGARGTVVGIEAEGLDVLWDRSCPPNELIWDLGFRILGWG